MVKFPCEQSGKLTSSSLAIVKTTETSQAYFFRAYSHLPKHLISNSRKTDNIKKVTPRNAADRNLTKENWKTEVGVFHGSSK